MSRSVYTDREGGYAYNCKEVLLKAISHLQLQVLKLHHRQHPFDLPSTSSSTIRHTKPHAQKERHVPVVLATMMPREKERASRGGIEDTAPIHQGEKDLGSERRKNPVVVMENRETRAMRE